MEKQLFEIPEHAMGRLQGALAKLNKKALKTESGAITLVKVGRRTEDDGSLVYIVAVEGDPVKYEGWTFIARLDHNIDPSGESNLVYVVPGETLAEEFWRKPAVCGHCGYIRRRKDTFILREDDSGTMKQVGRTCLKDFFGHDPAVITRKFQYITKLLDLCRGASEEPTENGPSHLIDRRHIDLEGYLGYVVMCIEENGWTSAKEAFNSNDKVATKEQALDAIFAWPRYTSPKPTKEQREIAANAVAFALTMDPSKSDFNFNITQMAKLETIDFKGAGIAAAIIFCYNRHLENEAKKTLNAAQSDLAGSEYQGTEKERLTLSVKILSSRSHEGDFGAYNITRMTDDAGNLFISFGAFKGEPGDQVAIKGTVKRHQEYNGVKQTVLNRVIAC